MWNMVIGQDRVRTSSHDHTVLCPCQITDQVAHVEEYSVLSGKPVIAVKIPKPCFQTKGFFPVFVKIREMFGLRIADRPFFRLKPVQHLIENFHIIVIDMQFIRQFKADIVSGASLGPADADDQMVIFRKFLSGRGIQLRSGKIHYVHLAETVRQ